MGRDISDHMWFEEAEDDEGMLLVFSDELCEALDIEEGVECETRVVVRDGKPEMEVEPKLGGLSDEQLNALGDLTDGALETQDTL